MISDAQLARSRAIQRRTGRTFHLATMFFPSDIRHATYVLYAFFRMADEIVDDPNPRPPSEQRCQLHRFRAAALSRRETDDPVLSAFAEVRAQHDIPRREVDAFIAAMQRDAGEPSHPVVFEDAQALHRYLRGSAVAVAYMMLEIMDPERHEIARPHARALGEAFQLTNFIRDVREDIVQYGRIYIPRTTIANVGAAHEDFAELETTPEIRAALRIELARAERKYRDGVAGIRYLPDGCRFPVLAAAVFYAEYHRLIRRREYDVLAGKPRLTVWRALHLIARTWWHWRRTDDPEATFFRVSPIEASTEITFGGRESFNAQPTARVRNLWNGLIDR